MTRRQWQRWLSSPMRRRWERMVRTRPYSPAQIILSLKFFTSVYELLLAVEAEENEQTPKP
jgi:hypothetical protein